MRVSTFGVPEFLPVATPCCQRKLSRVPFYVDATYVAKRTCPKCHARWQVVIRPLSPKKSGQWVHLLEWAQPYKEKSWN